LKRAILPPTPTGRRLLESVRRVEEDCCRRSALLMVCCDRDGERLSELYGVDPALIVEVPNGVDLESVSFVGPEERLAAKKALGIQSNFIALFMGSWHGPNLEAVHSIFEFARKLPDVSFLIVGSCGQAFANETLPKNVGLMGVVDDPTKDAILGIADVALNPMMSGSGTNLKMLDYLAAGIPVLSTPHGCRGLGLDDGIHVKLVDLDDFPQALKLCRGSDNMRTSRIVSGRNDVISRFSWSVIASKFRKTVEQKSNGTPVMENLQRLCGAV
jgi:glycosyltransferase involved in cell wall biosynthesis